MKKRERVCRDLTARPPRDLDVYDNGNNEQQTTCPRCGARTIIRWETKDGDRQKHHCPACNYDFLVDFTGE